MSVRVVAVLALAVVLLGLPGVARAEFGFESFETSLSAARPGGVVGAGLPVDYTASFELTTHLGGVWPVTPDGSLSDVSVDLPAGLLGNPLAVPRCRQSDLVGSYVFAQSGPGDGCPAATQVGVAYTKLATTVNEAPPNDFVGAPVFNMEPRHEGEPARLAFVVPLIGIVVNLSAGVRSESDYGVEASARGIVTTIPVLASTVTVWGVPGDSSHDPQRCSTPRLGCWTGGEPITLAPNPGLPLRPFLTAPTQCESSLSTTVRARSVEEPDREAVASHTLDGDPDTPGVNPLAGCGLVPFSPSLSVRARSGRVDSPTGLDVGVKVAQHDSTTVAQPSHLRRSVVALPEGLSINPAGAHGLVACTDAQLNLGARGPAVCPDGSKIASVEVDVPVLDRPVRGFVVQRPQTAAETFRVAIVASGSGVHLKLAGVVRPDPVSGRIVGVFENTPQAPFSELSVRFHGGAAAPLATPLGCATQAATGVFTPWSGTGDVALSVPMGFSWDGAGGGCPAALPLDVGLRAGTSRPRAGATSPLVVRLTRPDRNQELRSVSVDMPPGLSAYVAGVELCGEAAAAAGSCPAASRIGSVLAGAGAGPSPYYVGGDVFLTRPYKGGAYGLSVVVPVKAGPFDLGTVVVRSALHVDPFTAEIDVVSDPLPRIVEGVPLRTRDIRILVDRDRFAVNPTSCEPASIAATVTGYQGATTHPQTIFQALECASLAFKPRLAMRLVGRRQMRSGGHPAIRARLRHRPGQAAIRRARVVFPSTLALDPANARELCEHADAIKRDPACPKGSIVGRVRAVSPLLDRPLTGPVYFAKNVRRHPATGAPIRTLPMLVAKLRGEIAINLHATSNATRNGRLVTTFPQVPDAPVTRFDINVRGGKHGILVVTETRKGKINLCNRRQHAKTRLTAHNDATANRTTHLKTPCKKRRTPKRRRKH